MANRTIAIGDIHGCLTALNLLLDSIAPDDTDTIVTLGDYVDRGPNTRGVIDRLIQLQKECRVIPLYGNHEEMMLDVLEGRSPPYGWLQHGGVDTLDSYGFSGDMAVVPEEHRVFFSQLVDYYETDTHFFVHANYDPNLPLNQQPADMLRWTKLTEVVPPAHMSGKKAVLGHTHDRGGEIFALPYLICIDTYCYGGRWLTALDIETGKIWQTSESGKIRNAPS